MTVSDAERLARVTLNAVVEPGSVRALHDVVGTSACQALGRLRAGAGPHAAALGQRLAAVEPEAVLERAAAAGLRFVVPGDDEWPHGLVDLVDIEPLHERGGMPVGLWLKGPLGLAEACARSVAVVGSRSATTYGTGVAGDLAAGLSTEGHTIVSGAAFGIDQAGHRAALAMRGPTVAVLACGADRVYPSAHQRLLDYIADTGLVVSEAPIGGAPTRIRFLARNRLIAALSQGTVVVEAAIRSGALNTASWAESLGRVVMGVPGPVNSAPSQGVHELIRSRGALLVTRSEEVLEAVAPIGSYTLFDRREPATPRDRLSSAEREVLDAVPVARAQPAERIARVAGLPLTTVAEALSRLRSSGLVRERDGRWHLTVEEPS
jgi:DNA processing protein